MSRYLPGHRLDRASATTIVTATAAMFNENSCLRIILGAGNVSPSLDQGFSASRGRVTCGFVEPGPVSPGGRGADLSGIDVPGGSVVAVATA